MRSDRRRCGMTTTAVSLCVCAVSFATPPAPAPSTPPSESPPPAAPAPPPTLDDLLGLTPRADGSTPRGDADAPAPGDGERGATPGDGARARLDRTLREEELEDAFAQAVELMRESADRLGARADLGIDTQRVQEDAVRRLDSIIDAAKRMRQQQQSQRSSSRNRQDSSSQQPQGGEQEMQAAARREANAAQRREQRGSQQGQAEPPGLEEGELDETMHEGRVEWGSLPERIRELVQQGRRDRVSTLYLRLTGEYYRRMAEEASR